MAKIIVKGGNLVWEGKPGRGGHIMFILQWLEGLKRLGHEVLYHDIASGNIADTRLFSKVIKEHWKPSLSALVLPSGEACYGLNGSEVKEFASDADCIITLGCQFSPEPPSWLSQVHPRILIEQDPGFSHLWAKASSAENTFGIHDFYFTVGPHIGTSICSVPTFGIKWIPIWNPVVLDWWEPALSITRDRFTTVAGWWGNEYNIFEGKVWGPKAEEIKKFITLPKLTGEALEIALESSPDDTSIEDLRSHGWHIESPMIATANAETYREYVNSSAGEFSCAKGLYVGTQCGWFSDRSACYLAAGRPVVVQDTGIKNLLPVGKGLFAVSSVEEAAEAIQAIRSDYKSHAKAARELATEHFDSNKILSRLLHDVGIS